ncbi:hypothetical protein IWQ60_010024 [Tieghemiomyces parasiticus]|uniref:Fungal lipase-type domain-containing protein n=1 Tax=Tieghemiomyces parasiticus TaxID=78921 RepID=A0A9W7ZRH9_9FUNG|nr:hypothetical protein IWQ60_010024 [Tieghemiomyces parasiticus]
MAAYENVMTWDCVNCLGDTVGARFEDGYSVPATSLRWYLASHDTLKAIVLAHMGTNPHNMASFITDLMFFQAHWPVTVEGSGVHVGFLASVNSGIQRAVDAVRAAAKRYPTYRIILTGHSLGAAQSVLAAVYLAAMLPDIKDRLEVCTFGQPRVGNQAFVEFYHGLNISTKRVVNQGDLVPHLPFVAWQYHHHGNEYWIRSSLGDTVRCDTEGSTEYPDCSQGVPSAKWSVAAHRHYWNASTAVPTLFFPPEPFPPYNSQSPQLQEWMLPIEMERLV